MPDRETTIKELEKMLNGKWIWEHADFFALVCKGALELLKEQGPRVLTREEMVRAGKEHDAVYVEESPEAGYHKCFWGLAVEGMEPPKDGGYNYPGGVLFNVIDSCDDMWDGDFYGLKTPLGWRAWSGKPTDEQREAVKWDA